MLAALKGVANGGLKDKLDLCSGLEDKLDIYAVWTENAGYC